MLIMCVDNCLVFDQNNLFRILLSGIVNFICFIYVIYCVYCIYIVLYMLYIATYML